MASLAFSLSASSSSFAFTSAAASASSFSLSRAAICAFAFSSAAFLVSVSWFTAVWSSSFSCSSCILICSRKSICCVTESSWNSVSDSWFSRSWLRCFSSARSASAFSCASVTSSTNTLRISTSGISRSSTISSLISLTNFGLTGSRTSFASSVTFR